MKLYGIILSLSIICFYISACGGPRISTMCYFEEQQKYKTCPDGYEPGTVFKLNGTTLYQR